MADVLFRYLLMARDRDQSWFRRAFLADERLLAAGVERVVQTAAVRVETVAQYERITRVRQLVPASAVRNFQFYDEPEPHRPTPDAPEDRSERFPIRHTLTTNDCNGCRTTGIVDCPHCDGHGELVNDLGATGRPKLCPKCDGEKRVKHSRCGGEGYVAIWQDLVYSYSVTRTSSSHVPPDAPARPMTDALERWIARHKEPVEELTRESAAATLGYDTPQLARIVADSEQSRESQEWRARSGTFSASRCLFVLTRFHLVPVAGCALRSEQTSSAVRYWLLGRGEDAIELQPAPIVDAWKAAAWIGLFHAMLCGAAAAGAKSHFSLSLITALAFVGLVISFVGFRRVFRSQHERVRTIAILSCSAQQTSYLTNLATLGAFTRHLEILDRTYRTHLETLLGVSVPAPQAGSLVIRLPGRELVRLTEVKTPASLGRSEAARLMETVDGVIFLERPGQSMDSIRDMLHGVTPARPREARLMLEPDAMATDESGTTPRGGVGTEVIRRVFVREQELNLDWRAVFARLWAPVGEILEMKGTP